MIIPTWLGGAAIFGAVAASWDKIKWMIGRVMSLFVVHLQLERELARAITLYCWRNMRRGPFGSRRYSSFHEYVRPIKRNQVVAFEAIGKDPVVFWKGLRPLMLGSSNDEVEDGGPKSSWGRKVSITFIRGMFNIDQLVIDAATGFNNSLRRNEFRGTRFYVEYIFGRTKLSFDPDKDKDEKEEVSTGKSVNHLAIGDRRILKWKLDELGPEQKFEGSALAQLALPTEVDEMIQEARHWLGSEEWYRKHGIPWKRGWLLYGDPGTGKTSLIRAVAQDLDMPVWIYDIASLSNEEMLSAWRRMLTRIPVIAMIEDLDNVFEDRRNISSEFSGAMTYDALLNCLDGVEPADGVFIVITTNRIERLDPALGIPSDRDGMSTRPGRIDRVLKLKELDVACRMKLAKRILREHPAKIPETVESGDGDTGAQFQERCMRIALFEHWASKDLSKGVEIPARPEVPVELGRWGELPGE